MKNEDLQKTIDFMKTIGAAGLGSVFASSKSIADPNQPNAIDPNTPAKTKKPQYPQVPKRKLGKTGINIPV